MKDSMIFYYEWSGLINSLPDKERLEFYDNMMNPTKRAEFSSDNAHLKSIFDYVNSKVIANEIKYQEIVQKRRIAASSGGKQKVANATNRKTMEANPSYNANENVNEVTKVTKPPKSPKGGLPESILMGDGSFKSPDMIFEECWKIYPQIRSKGDKGKAREQFIRKMKEGINHETIKRGVEEFGRYCGSTGEKQPDMFRWIRDNGWEREYPEAKTPNRNNQQPNPNARQSYSDTLRNSVQAAKEIVRVGEGGIRSHAESGNNNQAGIDRIGGKISVGGFHASQSTNDHRLAIPPSQSQTYALGFGEPDDENS